MKALKVIAAIVVSLLLLGSEGMAMGIFSVDRALSVRRDHQQNHCRNRDHR